MRIEDSILSNLLASEEYTRKVIPHLSSDYFSERADSIIYDEINNFFLKFNELPTKEILEIQIGDRKGISNNDFELAIKLLKSLNTEQPNKLDWIVEKTEAFCRDRALYNAIMDSISIIDGKDKNLSRDSIPEILQRALGISFDTAVGHSYLNDAAERHDFYTRSESKIELDIDMLNRITSGGLPRKSLNILLAESGGGKSLVMSHLSAGCLRNGYNVLYISLEMAEERIAERIDANLLDIPVTELKLTEKNDFIDRVGDIAKKTQGKLYIKEYPQGSAHTGHFRGLLEELKVKQDFTPDIIFIDYLGICASARVRMGGSVNSYAYLKSIAEELRAFATEQNLPIVTAGQVNRGAYGSSDLDMSDTSEQMGIVHTADLMLGIVRTEELDEQNQVMFTQMKNRYSDPSANKRFIVGLNRAKMKLYNLDVLESSVYKQPEQSNESDIPPWENSPLTKSSKPALSGFKF